MNLSSYIIGIEFIAFATSNQQLSQLVRSKYEKAQLFDIKLAKVAKLIGTENQSRLVPNSQGTWDEWVGAKWCNTIIWRNELSTK